MTINNHLTKQAVKKALQGDWEEAIKLNKQILRNHTRDIGALNRLARSFVETDQIEKAKKTYRRTLKIDRYNPIALRKLDKLQFQKSLKTHSSQQVLPQTFLEEPGKTKTTKTIRPASTVILAQINAGEKLEITPKKRLVSLSFKKQYLGSLPEDISFRLIKLIKTGNQYTAFVKSVEKNSLTIFLKEVLQSPKNKNIISFP